MLVLILLWLVASFIMLTLGDALTSLYNKLTERQEKFNAVEYLLLGLIVLSITLGITSIWLPSNYIILGVYILASTAYWIIREEHRKTILQQIKEYAKRISIQQYIVVALVITTILAFSSWTSYLYDAVNYHYQLTTWYEKIGVAPGLVNIESRLGFNSNYLLLSSLFAIQSILGEPIFILQSLFATYMMLWILAKIVKTKYDIRLIILLLLFIIFLGVNFDNFFVSSTDILPSLIVFYIVATLSLNFSKIEEQYLLLFSVPVLLITLKLSFAPFILLSLYILYRLWRERKIKIIIVLSLLAIAITFPWLIRNVIITGYLIYPLPEIDLFSFDWKAPALVVEWEKDYIRDYGWHEFFTNFTLKSYREALHIEGLLAKNKMNLAFAILSWIINTVGIIAPIVILCLLLKKKRLHSVYMLLAINIFAVFLVWLSAPDTRFISGVLFSSFFLLIVVILLDKESLNIPVMGKLIVFLIIGILCLSSAKRTFNYFHKTKNIENNRQFASFLIKPYGLKAQKDISITDFSTYRVGDHDIYIPSNNAGASYDYIPSTIMREPADNIKNTHKFYPIQGVEARGISLKDGFRPKKDYDPKIWERDKDWWTSKIN